VYPDTKGRERCLLADENAVLAAQRHFPLSTLNLSMWQFGFSGRLLLSHIFTPSKLLKAVGMQELTQPRHFRANWSGMGDAPLPLSGVHPIAAPLLGAAPAGAV
jgi:hypothetical protein